jgi:steroid delta-isomerase-like uncharacterized protein
MGVEVPQIVSEYVDAWNRGDLDAWVATFAPDGTYSDPGTPQPVPAQGLKDHMAVFFAGFPDATCETVALHPIAEQLWVWRFVQHGTNTGSYRGMPSTGRELVVPGCEFIEVGGDKVHRVEGYFDRLTILGQLGLVPSPPPPAGT